jgi:type I restriction enzyme S subunit
MSLWQRCRLGELLEIKHGYAFKGEFFSDAGERVLLTPGNFRESGGLKLKGDKEKYYTGEFPEEFLLRRGDLLVAMTDLTQNAPILGSPAFIPASDRFLHNQRLGKVINLKQDAILPEFLFYLLNTTSVRAQIKGSASGATVRHTSPSRIYDVYVEIPPLQTQRRIAEILSGYDDLIENSQRPIKILETMARAIYREWFVRFRFPGHGEVKMMDSSLGMIPEGWDVNRLQTICESITSGGTPSTSVRGYWDGGIPWLSSGETGNSFIIATDKTITKEGVSNSNTRLARSGCTVIAGAGQGKTRGQTSMLRLDCYINQSIIALTADGKQSTDSFLFFNLSSRYSQFRQISDGSSRGSLTTKLLAELEVIVPPENLVNKFDDLVAPIVKSIEINLRTIQNLRRTRDLLLPRLLSGQIDIDSVPA